MSDAKVTATRPARAARVIGTALVFVGVGLVVWGGVVWKWSDPVTAAYTTWQQRKLDREFSALKRNRVVPVPERGVSTPEAVAMVRRAAERLRREADPGEAIGRLRVPRLGVDMVIVEGTDTGSLRRGPGRDARTFMPGEGKLVYIAGHRTTYSAPFASIDRLRVGDRITVEMPYGTFVYDVSRHRIVDDQELSVLESGRREEIALQACHPRFFATQRYIVWAEPAREAVVANRGYARPS